VTDSGLAAALAGVDLEALASPTEQLTGALLETFVVNEIAQQVSASKMNLRLHHYRDSRGHEVDLIVERSDDKIVAVEVKATSSPRIEDLKQLAWLRDRLDESARGTFTRGLLLHTGTHRFKVGDRLQMLPISSIWD